MSESHPSFLQLDKAALDGVPSSETARHIAKCSQCAAHLSAVQKSQIVPGWVKTAQLKPQLRNWTRAWLGIGSTLAVAAGLFFILHRKDHPTSRIGQISAKGANALQVHVKREESVFLWDGTETISAGDALRITIAAEPYRFAGLYSRSQKDNRVEFSTLFEGLTSDGSPFVVPGAWLVDAAPSDETIVVVLSHIDMRSQALSEQLGQDENATLQSLRTQGAWIHTLVLPKKNREKTQP